MNKLKLFRAAYLLVAGSALVFWLISFWLPLNEYLLVLSNPKFEKYQSTLKSLVALFIIYALLNLVTAVVVATNLFGKKIKFYLTLVPGVLLIVMPFVLTLILNTQLPKLNYFQVIQGTYSSLRFARADTFALAMLFVLLAGTLNILAAVIVRQTESGEKLPKQYRTRYITYTAIIAVFLSVFVVWNTHSAGVRKLDRAACISYKSRLLPVVDNEVPAYLSDLMVYGESAGSQNLQDAFISFSTLSRQYFAALDTENGSVAVGQLEVQVAAQRTILADICSEYAAEQ